jgi:hypothetical protein
MAQVFVGVEKIGDMRMSSPQLTETRDMNSNGAIFMMGTGGRVNAGETLEVHLSGMPAHGHAPRNVALALTALIFAAGAWFAFSPAKAHAAQDAALRSRREKLMNEVVSLERKRRQKGLSDADEAKLQRTTAELERVVAELDRAGDGAAA